MRYLLAGLLVVVALPAFGQNGTATISCTPPTNYTDGSPIGAAVITYRFYRGASQSGPFTLETRTSTTCGTTYTGLAAGTHWFVATATVSGVESAQTPPASKVIAPPVPQPPSSITVASTRIEPESWTCRDPDGTILSRHERQDKAQESCTNFALANLGKAYEMRPSGYRIVANF